MHDLFRRFGLPVVALFALSGIIVLTTVVATAQGPQGATLTVVSGEVAVVQSNGSAYQPARSGLTLGVGDQVGSLANSTALVTFFEGSEVELGSNTTVLIREVRGSGNEVHVTIEDVFGSTVSRIQAFANPSSSFRVQNPGGQVVTEVRGVAAVRGEAPTIPTLFGELAATTAGQPGHLLAEARQNGGPIVLAQTKPGGGSQPAACGVPGALPCPLIFMDVDIGTGYTTTGFRFTDNGNISVGGATQGNTNTLSVSSNGAITTGGDPGGATSVPGAGSGNATGTDAGGDEGSKNDDGDEEEDEEEPSYDYRGPTPLSGELTRGRLTGTPRLDLLTATGSILAFGMIGWSFGWSGPRRRQK